MPVPPQQLGADDGAVLDCGVGPPKKSVWWLVGLIDSIGNCWDPEECVGWVGWIGWIGFSDPSIEMG